MTDTDGCDIEYPVVSATTSPFGTATLGLLTEAFRYKRAEPWSTDEEPYITIGALVIRIRFWSPFSISIIRNAQNSIGNYLDPFIIVPL